MRQATWIAFLLLTFGLVTYEASIGDSATAPLAASDSGPQTEEGGGDIPPDDQAYPSAE